MYLKSIKLSNFRKFKKDNNLIEFVGAEKYNTTDPNIGEKVTLIVGKNNSGKTTIINALDKLINTQKFDAYDFNFNYLNESLENNIRIINESGDFSDFIIPELHFELTIGLDIGEDDLITNLAPFLPLKKEKLDDIKINIKWKIQEESKFKEEFKNFVLRKKNFKENTEREIYCKSNSWKYLRFDKYLELLNNTEFKLYYYNQSGKEISNFNIKNLINISLINANKVEGDRSLSNAFSNIFEFKYKDDESIKDIFTNEIIDINIKLEDILKENYSGGVNDAIASIISSDKFEVLLRSDLNFKKLINNIIKYEYLESDLNIPEYQYGLGYTNLMMVIASIISYMEKYPKEKYNSHINLISIEEPEAFMHPKLQEQFIDNVQDIICSLLESHDKNINSQIIITTHSPYIVNSKIHTENKFDSINYINTINGQACAVPLKDSNIIDGETGNALHNLRYLKKHISYYVSELFFSDALIFVEGITEYTLLKYYININEKLKLYNISIFLVNGAHAHVYNRLIQELRIPSIVITDLDIKREKKEKGEKDNGQFKQIIKDDLEDRETTNHCLIHYTGKQKVEEIIEWINDSELNGMGNLKILTQSEDIEGYYATSFEEALILSNFDNEIVNETIEDTIPKIYEGIIADGGVKINSFKLQKKLSGSKSNFANNLLYKILIENDTRKLPKLPKYIEDGFKFILEQLEGDKND